MDVRNRWNKSIGGPFTGRKAARPVLPSVPVLTVHTTGVGRGVSSNESFLQRKLRRRVAGMRKNPPASRLFF